MGKLLLFTYFTFLAVLLSGQTTTLYFSQLTPEEGLTSGAITSFYEDRRGFLWIPTSGGLCRYDGHEVVVFKSDPVDLNSLSSNRVYDLVEDKNGVFWITTLGGGLNSYDPQTGQFRHFKHDSEDETTLTDDFLSLIELDSAGGLWIASSNGLNYFDPATGRNTQFQAERGVAGKLQGANIAHLYIDDEKVYLTTSAGFEYYDKQTQTFRFFPLIDESTGDTTYYQLYGFWKDHTGKCWIGMPGKGLRVYDPATDQVTFFDVKTKDGRRNARPMRMVEDRHQTLWILGYQTIWRLSPDRTTLEHCIARDVKTNEMLTNGMYNIYEDRSGVIWIGTPGNRALYYDTRREFFDYHQFFKEDGTPVEINALYQSDDEVLWCGTADGLYRYNFNTGQTHIFNKGIRNNRIIPFAEGRFLLSFTAGVFLFNTKTFEQTEILLGENQQRSIQSVMYATFDQDGDLWVSTWGNGLYRIKEEALNQQTGVATTYDNWRAEPGNPKTISTNKLHKILVDRHNHIWICGDGYGLTQYDKATDRFQVFNYTQGDSNGIASNYTFDALEDKDGNIWVTTRKSGLNKYSPETRHFKTYGAKDGLASENLFKLAFDRQGKIWLLTAKGISCFDPATETFTNYDRKDGLQSWEYALHSNQATGEIFVGGPKGFHVFEPEAMQLTSNQASPMRLASLRHYDPQLDEMKPAPLKALEQGKLRLSHRENTLDIRFAVLDYRNPDKHRYQYSLVPTGQSPNWLDLGNQNRVQLLSVAPGNYSFLVRGRNSSGIWSALDRPLLIAIQPPWWASNLAYLCYLLLLFLAVFTVYRFQLKRQKEKSEALRLQELDSLKTRLYTNITHEFRTPLSIIIGVADNINDHRNERQMILRNSKNLLRLVNQLLGLSKLEAGNMEVNFIQSDIVVYLRYLTESFHSAAKDKDIQMEFIAEPTSIVMDYDEVKIQHILYNLLSNALKFTESGGTVKVEVTKKQRNNRDHLQIKVIDNGVGISDRELPKVFERFYQVDASTTRKGEGTGIGLTLVKELVELLQGWIGVKSTLGKGTEFTIYLPIHRTGTMKKFSVEEMAGGVIQEALVPDQQGTSSVLKGPAHEQPQLLVIEDNADVATYIKTCVQEQFEVRFAANGREGITTALREVPDIIISDIMMPEADGYEVTNTLKSDQRTSHIPIILLTAKATQEDKLSGLQTGADAYLIKPFDKRELLVRLKKLLELRKRLQEKYRKGSLFTTKESKTTLDDQFIQKINAIITENISDPELGIIQLCEAVHLSHTQVFRKLKALTGESPTGYIRKIRLEKAKELLESTALNVSEIAYRLGFTDPNYFSRAFSKAFGMPPSAVRDQG